MFGKLKYLSLAFFFGETDLNGSKKLAKAAAVTA
jgi:hypothetical protein